MLKLPHHWIWDFWFAQNGSDFHTFYLQAPRSLGDPDLRHWNVCIGHAVSHDLTNWQVLPDALSPSPEGSDAWDDYTTWTGSIIQHQSLWYLFYTGTKRSEKGKIQRIGLATSTDLIHWEKHPANPLIEADPTWYEKYNFHNPTWGDEAWRDPWVFQDAVTGDFHMYMTARVNKGDADARGVIGHAWSKDLLSWRALPPVTAPGHFGQLEVPQLVQLQGRSVLLFSTAVTTHSAQWQLQTGLTPVSGTHFLAGQNPLGPFTLTTPRFMVGDRAGSLYAGKMIQNADGQWVFLAWRNVDETGQFLGELSDPHPVRLDPAGNPEVI
ncbi:MAG TPA: hypothetical protein PKW33_16730 [Anaerolineaceae bacterium]|nr:hypothetical protein [Anaerolineaceae bacterium]HPN53244.1 hypothetical protein [Anaerolineaceae bacterium]